VNVSLNWPCTEDSACYAKCPFPSNLSGAEHNRLGQCQSPFIGTKKVFRGPYTKVLPANGAQAAGAALDHSDYLRGRYLRKRCIPPTVVSKQHFPPNINNRDCATLYMTKDAAVAGGLYNPHTN
jgi:hypothetical protein